MSRPGTNYTERSCAKRSVVEPSHNESNSPSASGLVGDAGPLGPGDAMSKPESGPEVSSFTTLRFPSTPIHNFGSSFAPFNSFGSDAMDRLPTKNNPPVRNQHSSGTLCLSCLSLFLCDCQLTHPSLESEMSIRSAALPKSDGLRSGHVEICHLAPGRPASDRADGGVDRLSRQVRRGRALRRHQLQRGQAPLRGDRVGRERSRAGRPLHQVAHPAEQRNGKLPAPAERCGRLLRVPLS